MFRPGRRRAPVGEAIALALGMFGVAAFVPQGCVAATIVAQSQPEPQPSAAPDQNQQKIVTENVEPLALKDAAPVLGKRVKGPNGEDLGLVVDILVDTNGQPRAAVIDFGGFLGVGSRKVAIEWKALDFTALGRAGTVELGLSRAQIAAAPEYKPGPPGAEAVTPPPAPAPPVDTHK